MIFNGQTTPETYYVGVFATFQTLNSNGFAVFCLALSDGNWDNAKWGRADWISLICTRCTQKNCLRLSTLSLVITAAPANLLLQSSKCLCKDMQATGFRNLLVRLLQRKWMSCKRFKTRWSNFGHKFYGQSSLSTYSFVQSCATPTIGILFTACCSVMLISESLYLSSTTWFWTTCCSAACEWRVNVLVRKLLSSTR